MLLPLLQSGQCRHLTELELGREKKARITRNNMFSDNGLLDDGVMRLCAGLTALPDLAALGLASLRLGRSSIMNYQVVECIYT